MKLLRKLTRKEKTNLFRVLKYGNDQIQVKTLQTIKHGVRLSNNKYLWNY